MKKIQFIIITVLLIITAFFAFGLEEYIPELPSRLALYHNTGEINLTIDGESVNLNDVAITFSQGDFKETTKINDGKFKIRKGLYGENIFKFEIPNNLFKVINAEFGHFNTNWWHKVNYEIDIEILSNADSTLTANIRQKVLYGKELMFENEGSDILVDGSLTTVSVFAGP